MRKPVTLASAVLLSGAVFLGLAMPASAAGTGLSAVAVQAPAKKVSNESEIGIVKKLPIYRPKTVTGPMVSKANCANPQSNYTAVVVNVSKKTQQMTMGGQTFGPPIPPKGALRLCGLSQGSVKFSLVANPAAVLTVNVT